MLGLNVQQLLANLHRRVAAGQTGRRTFADDGLARAAKEALCQLTLNQGSACDHRTRERQHTHVH